MPLIEKRPPSRKELQWFGLLCAAFFGVLGGILWWRGMSSTTVLVLWAIGAAVTAFYYLLKPIQQPFYLLWINMAYPIGWVVSHLMLVLVFYGVMTPIGLFMRLLGRDPLHRRFDRSAGTYWVAHDPGVTMKRYFQQF